MIQRPPCEEMLALAVRNIQDRHDPAAVDLYGNFPVPLLDTLSNVGKHDLGPLVHLVIVKGIFEDEGKDSEVAEIGLVDPGETLGDLDAHPEVVILDEPTSGLDVSVQATILKLFTDLKFRFHLTYLFISHNLGVVQMMCGRVAVMYGGRIVEMGETSRLFAEPLHPYTKVLLAAIPVVGKRKEEDLSLSGEPPNPADFPSGCRFWPRCVQKEDRCTTEEPPLVPVEQGREVSCHRFSGSGW